MRFVAGGAPWRSCWPGHQCWRGAVKTGQAPRWSCWPEQVLAGAGAGRGSVGRGAAAERHLEDAGRGAAAERHLEDDGRGAVANSHREDDGRGAVAKSHREATAGGSANTAASGRDCWPGRCGRARPPLQKSKGGQCDQRTASISAQIASERTASVLCADCRRRGLEFEGDFCQEVDLCLRIYALPAEVFRTIYKVVLAIPSVRVVLFVEEVVYNSGEGNAGAAL